MSGATWLYVICYDVSDDRRRRRLARLLEAEAVRVQGSVFEMHTTERAAWRLASRAARHLASSDSLRLYPLDRDARRRTQVFGPGPLPRDERFFLL